jgi:hypothetical protein
MSRREVDLVWSGNYSMSPDPSTPPSLQYIACTAYYTTVQLKIRRTVTPHNIHCNCGNNGCEWYGDKYLSVVETCRDTHNYTDYCFYYEIFTSFLRDNALFISQLPLHLRGPVLQYADSDAAKEHSAAATMAAYSLLPQRLRKNMQDYFDGSAVVLPSFLFDNLFSCVGGCSSYGFGGFNSAELWRLQRYRSEGLHIADRRRTSFSYSGMKARIAIFPHHAPELSPIHYFHDLSVCFFDWRGCEIIVDHSMKICDAVLGLGPALCSNYTPYWVDYPMVREGANARVRPDRHTRSGGYYSRSTKIPFSAVAQRNWSRNGSELCGGREIYPPTVCVPSALFRLFPHLNFLLGGDMYMSGECYTEVLCKSRRPEWQTVLAISYYKLVYFYDR